MTDQLTHATARRAAGSIVGPHPSRRFAAWAAAGCAVTVLLAGCGGVSGKPLARTVPQTPSGPAESSTAASSPSPSSSDASSSESSSSAVFSTIPSSTGPVSSGADSGADDAVYASYRQAVHENLDPQVCAQALNRLSEAVQASKMSDAHNTAATYRTALYTMDGAVRQVDCPDRVRTQVNTELLATKAEIADLDSFATTSADVGALIGVDQIFVDDDARVLADEQLSGALGHPVADPQMPFLVAGDQLRLAEDQMLADFQAAQHGAMDLAGQQAAATAEAKALAPFMATLQKIDFPGSVSADVTTVTTAANALSDLLQANMSVTNTAALQPFSDRFSALGDAVSALERQPDTQMAPLPQPDHGCTDLTQALPAPTTPAGSSPAATASSAAGLQISGTGWTASVPHSWHQVAPQSGDDVDLQAGDGSVVAIAKPVKAASSDPHVVGKAAADALAGEGYRITSSVTVGDWATAPAFQVTVRTKDGAVDVLLTGIIHAGTVIDVSVALPKGTPDTSPGREVVAYLIDSWRWA